MRQSTIIDTLISETVRYAQEGERWDESAKEMAYTLLRSAHKA